MLRKIYEDAYRRVLNTTYEKPVYMIDTARLCATPASMVQTHCPNTERSNNLVLLPFFYNSGEDEKEMLTRFIDFVHQRWDNPYTKLIIFRDDIPVDNDRLVEQCFEVLNNGVEGQWDIDVYYNPNQKQPTHKTNKCFECDLAASCTVRAERAHNNGCDSFQQW